MLYAYDVKNSNCEKLGLYGRKKAVMLYACCTLTPFIGIVWHQNHLSPPFIKTSGMSKQECKCAGVYVTMEQEWE
ncbi:hypothetical protein LXL04_014054 [Taraxacum kok-saghyz]